MVKLTAGNGRFATETPRTQSWKTVFPCALGGSVAKTKKAGPELLPAPLLIFVSRILRMA
jgi:hypothetical protein